MDLCSRPRDSEMGAPWTDMVKSWALGVFFEIINQNREAVRPFFPGFKASRSQCFIAIPTSSPCFVPVSIPLVSWFTILEAFFSTRDCFRWNVEMTTAIQTVCLVLRLFNPSLSKSRFLRTSASVDLVAQMRQYCIHIGNKSKRLRNRFGI